MNGLNIYLYLFIIIFISCSNITDEKYKEIIRIDNLTNNDSGYNIYVNKYYRLLDAVELLNSAWPRPFVEYNCLYPIKNVISTSEKYTTYFQGQKKELTCENIYRSGFLIESKYNDGSSLGFAYEKELLSSIEENPSKDAIIRKINSFSYDKSNNLRKITQSNLTYDYNITNDRLFIYEYSDNLILSIFEFERKESFKEMRLISYSGRVNKTWKFKTSFDYTDKNTINFTTKNYFKEDKSSEFICDLEQNIVNGYVQYDSSFHVVKFYKSISNEIASYKRKCEYGLTTRIEMYKYPNEKGVVSEEHLYKLIEISYKFN